MPPHVLHCWSYGQGRWRGHHWQWPRARLHQYQHLHPCSGCPRCSDAMTPTCRRRPSALAKNVAVYPHKSVFHAVFCGGRHSAQPTECRHRKKPRGKRLWRAGATLFSSADGRRRHAGVIASERRGRPEHGFRCWYGSSLALGHCH